MADLHRALKASGKLPMSAAGSRLKKPEGLPKFGEIVKKWVELGMGCGRVLRVSSCRLHMNNSQALEPLQDHRRLCRGHLDLQCGSCPVN